MEVKAIALDIDGTLTDDSKRITPRTKEALLEAERKGVRLILASGRPAHGLRRIARELELESHGGMLLAYNGAQVRDAATGELLFDQPMSEGDARAVLAHMREFDVIPMLVDGDRLYVEDAYRCEILHKGVAKNIIKYERDMCDLRVHEVRDIVGWCRLPQDKVLVAGTDTYLAEHHAEMAAPFADRLCCTFTADFYFEFTAPGIDKANALRKALPQRGIDISEVVAFGDGQNDASMLAAAGMGVAMGNAVKEARDAADMITATNNEDGIARALEELLS